jgi:hypothetical protein
MLGYMFKNKSIWRAWGLRPILTPQYHHWKNLNKETNRFRLLVITLSSVRRYGKYNINRIRLGHTEHVKMLGVYVSFNLFWNTHVEYTREICAKFLWFVERNLKSCTSKIKCQAFQTHRIWHVTWCPGVAPHYCRKYDNMIKLQRVQNKASRLICHRAVWRCV